ncbi:metal ABC transporter permease [Phenylobacterium sp.]|uniref:metal ABC transporter permease n=1 Tax=Phenylobacterium sp. TaxID=1871053 RepID=UPI0025F548DB|nr:metal ABC transporter permease [Phenylobacterium sp.]
MNTGAIELSILIPAFLAGMLVLSTHVPMGQQVLGRGIVFIDLSIAQVAGLGVTIAGASGQDPKGWTVQAAACGAALIGALLLTWTEKKWPEVQEALIGVLFVAAASVELLLLANNPHGGEHLKDLLVGQILWVTIPSLLPIAAFYAVALAIWFGFRDRLGQVGFYVLFALVVTQSVQLVGVYLVFASLIVPALAARRFVPRLRLWVGYGVGVTGYVLGLIVSSLMDLPTGAAIVVTLIAAFVGAVIVSAVVPRTLRAQPLLAAAH